MIYYYHVDTSLPGSYDSQPVIVGDEGVYVGDDGVYIGDEGVYTGESGASESVESSATILSGVLWIRKYSAERTGWSDCSGSELAISSDIKEYYWIW